MQIRKIYVFNPNLEWIKRYFIRWLNEYASEKIFLEIDW